MKIDTVVIENRAVGNTVNDSSASDSTGLEASGKNFWVEEPTNVAKPVLTYEYNSVPAKKAYFRKTFEINGLPVSGEITLSVDNSYNLFLNGEYIAASNGGTRNWEAEKVHNLNDYLRLGTNTLAIEAIDSDKSGNGLKAVINITLLPGWDKKQQQFKFRMLDSAEKERLIFNKNIIVY